jgi:hypothetical protein
MDIRLRDGIFYILDINPNPDISSDASMACAAEAAGFSFGAMGSHLIHLAAARHPLFGKQLDRNKTLDNLSRSIKL